MEVADEAVVVGSSVTFVGKRAASGAMRGTSDACPQNDILNPSAMISCRSAMISYRGVRLEVIVGTT